MTAGVPLKVREYEDLAAFKVLNNLDPMDLMEARAVRGASVTNLQLFADWRAMEAHRALSAVLWWGQEPFAVLGLSNTGQAGVAQAALLSRNHRKFARALASAAIEIRNRMPAYCQAAGIKRVEARSWKEHRSAAAFLKKSGFAHEADLFGFGGREPAIFQQYAWVAQVTI